MRNTAKKGFALLLTLAVLFGTVPGFTLTASAAETTVTTYAALVAAAGTGTADVVRLNADIIVSNYAENLSVGHNLTLDLNGYNLTIVTSSGNCIKIGADVTLTITDSLYVRGTSTNKLTVTNNALASDPKYGAGINTSEGTLIINSGNIAAIGKFGGAGIGGGDGGGGGNITINGGTITATGGDGGAGIGGGNGGGGGTITIESGAITAQGGNYGAGIGGGNNGGGGAITISGGEIHATGGSNGAGIGGGSGGSGGTINISDGETHAQGGFQAAGIGGGGAREGGTITISGGEIEATGGLSGAGIGGGNMGEGGAATISGGNVAASGGGAGAGDDIGGGALASGGNITIAGGSVKAVHNSINSQPTKDGFAPVYLATLTVGGVGDGVPLVAAGYGSGGATANYGVNDVVTRDGGKVYFYLPADTYAANSIAVALSGAKYDNGAVINIATDNNTTGALDNNSSRTLYTVTFGVQDGIGDPWYHHGRAFSCPTASLQNANTDMVTINSFLPGSYAIYDGAAYTGRSISVGDPRPLTYFTPAASDFSLSNNSATYDGSAKSVTVTPQNGAGTVTATYYTGTGSTTYGNSATPPTAAGTYDVTINTAEGTWSNGGLYLAANGLNVGTLTINPKTVDAAAILGVTAPVYGGTPVTAFTAPQYTGTVTWSGALTSGNFDYGVAYTATITLTPEANYTLTGVAADFFTVAGATTVTNTADSGTVTVEFPAIPRPTYSLTVSAGANGTVGGTSSGSYAENTAISVTATPNSGCHFKDWTVSGVTISGTANPAEFSMPANAVTLTANFEADDPTVTGVTVSPLTIDVQQGTAQLFSATVSGSNSPARTVTWSVAGGTGSTNINASGLLTVDAAQTSGSALTVRATSTVDTGKYGEAVVTVTDAAPTPTYSISLDTGDYAFPGEIESYAAQTPKTVTVTNTGNQATGDLTVALSGPSSGDFTLSTSTVASIAAATDGTFTVSPNIGLSQGNYTATVTVSGSNGITANFDVSFAVAPATYSVTVQDDGNGTASASHASAMAGTTVTLTATPNNGYQFKEWNVVSGGVTISGNTFNMLAANVEIKAIFEPIPAPTYTITLNANGGTVSPASALTGADGKLTTLPTPTRSGSYRFDGWFTAASGGTQVTTATVFSANATIYAHWTYTGYTGGGYTPPVVGGGSSGGGSSGSGNSYPNATVSGLTSAVFDKADGKDIAIPLSPASYKLRSVRNGSETLAEGADYTVSGNRVTIKAAYLQTLKTGEHTLTIVMSGGLDPTFTIEVKDSEQDAPEVPAKTDPPLNFPFADVDEGAWYYDDVHYAWENGLFEGTNAEGTLFSPNMSVSRGMIVTVLYRLAGEPGIVGGAAFDDVDANAYYAKAMAWAKANGIVGGIGNNMFTPDAPVTRQDLTVILMNYAKHTGARLPVTREYESFLDDADSANYAKDAIEAFFRAGIINGKGGGLFDPTGTATRAELAAMLRRFIENVMK
jgi:hypothetical protein